MHACIYECYTDIYTRYGEGDDEDGAGLVNSADTKPRILLMGLRRYMYIYVYTCALLHELSVFGIRSGKSSIQKVVFHKLSPNETLFLDSTSKIVKDGKSCDVVFCIMY